jgi:hypothetical protein
VSPRATSTTYFSIWFYRNTLVKVRKVYKVRPRGRGPPEMCGKTPAPPARALRMIEI